MNTNPCPCENCQTFINETSLYECTECFNYYCPECVDNSAICKCACLMSPMADNATAFEGYGVAIGVPPVIAARINNCRCHLPDNCQATTIFNANQVPHITLATGISKDNLEHAMAFVATQLPFTIIVGGVSVLQTPDYAVLVKEAEASQLLTLHKKLIERYATKPKYPYWPHITLGFLKLHFNTATIVSDLAFTWRCDFQASRILAFSPNGEVAYEKTLAIAGCHSAS